MIVIYFYLGIKKLLSESSMIDISSFSPYDENWQREVVVVLIYPIQFGSLRILLLLYSNAFCYCNEFVLGYVRVNRYQYVIIEAQNDSKIDAYKYC